MKNKIISPFKKSVYLKNAQVYKILANHIRLEILNILAGREVTVQNLSAAIGISSTNTSQHLTVLRHFRLVKTRRHGTSIYYSLVDERIVVLCKVLNEIYSS